MVQVQQGEPKGDKSAEMQVCRSSSLTERYIPIRVLGLFVRNCMDWRPSRYAFSALFAYWLVLLWLRLPREQLFPAAYTHRMRIIGFWGIRGYGNGRFPEKRCRECSHSAVKCRNGGLAAVTYGNRTWPNGVTYQVCTSRRSLDRDKMKEHIPIVLHMTPQRPLWTSRSQTRFIGNNNIEA